MTSVAEGALSEGNSRTIAAAFGFIPNLFRAQADLSAAVEAQSELINSILVKGIAFDRAAKHSFLSEVAVANCNEYLFALTNKGDAGRVKSDLLAFAGALARRGPCVSKDDVDLLRGGGLSESAILEIIATVALGNMVCTLARALEPALDAGSHAEMPQCQPIRGPAFHSPAGPYLRYEKGIGKDVANFLREQYGFVPVLFRSQGEWPDLLAAEARALELIIFAEDHLTRIQKESILLATSARNLSTYGTALHSQVLTVLGLSADTVNAIVDDVTASDLALNDKALLTQISYLAVPPGARGGKFEPTALAESGFTGKQVLEAVATAGLGNFLNTLQFGLGVPPDFPPRYVFTEKDLYRAMPDARLTSDAAVRPDPDADLVARVQAGETEAFEELARRHMRRIFGILNGILGNYDEAHETTQEVFVKAFEHLSSFQGRSKLSTWLTSIAVNTATELLRQRKPMVPLEDAIDEDFRPRRVLSWGEDPEALFAAAQMQALVRDAVLRLPQKYRVAVLLREINQLSTEDAAEALGLSVPALKARVLRGRLMLRESLAAHFLPPESKNA